MPLYSFEGVSPTIADDAFIAPTATLVGDVRVEAGASVWYGAVLRADFSPIFVRAGANIQDGSVLHSGIDEFPPLDADEMEKDMAELKNFDSLMIVHAEDSRAIDRAPAPEGDRYQRFLSSRPRGAENLAIAEVIEQALRESGIPAEASDVLSHLKIELPTAQLGAASRTLAEMRLI